MTKPDQGHTQLVEVDPNLALTFLATNIKKTVSLWILDRYPGRRYKYRDSGIQVLTLVQVKGAGRA